MAQPGRWPPHAAAEPQHSGHAPYDLIGVRPPHWCFSTRRRSSVFCVLSCRVVSVSASDVLFDDSDMSWFRGHRSWIVLMILPLAARQVMVDGRALPVARGTIAMMTLLTGLVVIFAAGACFLL